MIDCTYFIGGLGLIWSLLKISQILVTRRKFPVSQIYNVSDDLYVYFRSDAPLWRKVVLGVLVLLSLVVCPSLTQSFDQCYGHKEFPLMSYIVYIRGEIGRNLLTTNLAAMGHKEECSVQTCWRPTTHASLAIFYPPCSCVRSTRRLSVSLHQQGRRRRVHKP